MTALSDLINQRLAALGWDGLSLRDLAEKSNGALSKDNVAIYRKGTHGMPSEATLASWSDILQTPIEDLREAAGMPRGGEQFSLPPEAARLNQRQRRAITELIMSMIEGAASENTSTEASSTTSSSDGGVRRGRRTPMKNPLSVVPGTVEPTGSEGDLGLVASDGNRDHEEEVRRLIDEGLREQGRHPDQK